MTRMPPHASQLTIRVDTPDWFDLLCDLRFKKLFGNGARVSEAENNGQFLAIAKWERKECSPCSKDHDVRFKNRAVCKF